MGLLSRHRRAWLIVILCVLSVPALIQAIQVRATVSLAEGRRLAEPPPWPQSFGDLTQSPRQLEHFLEDHFGLREFLVSTNAIARYATGSPSSRQVTFGRDKWLFLAGNNLLEQSAGLVLRPAEIERFADFSARLYAHLRPRGIAFLVASPPNSATIVREQLPSWAATNPSVTEYDLLIKAFAARGVPAVDLRPALLAAQSRNLTYRRTDTHWNDLGALAAYNAVVEALGKPEWTIDPQRVHKGFHDAPGGDLARLLGMASYLTEPLPIMDLAAYVAPAPLISSSDPQPRSQGEPAPERKGTAVLVIGDSFTMLHWQHFFRLHAGQYHWMSHQGCDFPLTAVEAYRPDIVILAPTERLMRCTDNIPILAGDAP